MALLKLLDSGKLNFLGWRPQIKLENSLVRAYHNFANTQFTYHLKAKSLGLKQNNPIETSY